MNSYGKGPCDAAPASPSNSISGLIERLSALSNSLAQAAGTMTDIANRISGPVPASGAGGNAAARVQPTDILGRLSDVADNLWANLEVLEAAQKRAAEHLQ